MMIYCVIRKNESLICHPIVFKIYNIRHLGYKLLIFIKIQYSYRNCYNVDTLILNSYLSL